MRANLIIRVESLLNYDVQAGLPDGRWVPARPEGYYSLRYRLRAAWLVFTGRADALIWTAQ